jgi:hypothetical protein
MLPRILYAFGCLITIWGLGAGNPATFDSRALILSLLWAVLAVIAVVTSKSKPNALPKFDASAFNWGAPLSLLVSSPFLILLLVPIESLRSLVGYEATMTYLKSTSVVSMAALVLLCVPSWALVSRGFLQTWGVSGVALLDGITVGFSSQRLLLFLWVWLSSLMWGKIAQVKGFWVAFISQVLSAILLASLVRLK